MGDTDNAKRAWMLNFLQKLTESMSTYMVGPIDVASIAGAVNDFVAKLAVVQSPDGRNPTTTAAKNNSRAAARAICAQYVRGIKFNAGISDEAKLAAGIKPPTSQPEPRPCPLSKPLLGIAAATNGAHTLTYADSLDQYARRKPLGADGMDLYVAISDEPNAPFSEAKYYRKFTTTPMPVFFQGGDAGKFATYYGRWVGQRGDVGTMSDPVCMAIAA